MVAAPPVVRRFEKVARGQCAPAAVGTGRGRDRGGGQDGQDGQNGQWTCLRSSDVLQLKQWLKELGLDADPRAHGPHCAARDDACVLDSLSKRGVVGAKQLARERLVPAAPASWRTKPSTWLTTPEFGQVMRQYEAAFAEFEFLGATPIDFDKPIGSSCVWPRICRFTIAKAVSNGKTKIGFVFNEDDHTGEGSHWICAFLDIPRGVFYYIDSVANDMPKEIATLARRLGSEYKRLYGRALTVHESKIPHQRGDNQCGMYCLFFIITLLTETATYKELTGKRIPDLAMADLRKVLFRAPTDRHPPKPSAAKRSKTRKRKRHSKRGRGKRVRTRRRG